MVKATTNQWGTFQKGIQWKKTAYKSDVE